MTTHNFVTVCHTGTCISSFVVCSSKGQGIAVYLRSVFLSTNLPLDILRENFRTFSITVDFWSLTFLHLTQNLKLLNWNYISNSFVKSSKSLPLCLPGTPLCWLLDEKGLDRGGWMLAISFWAGEFNKARSALK